MFWNGCFICYVNVNDINGSEHSYEKTMNTSARSWLVLIVFLLIDTDFARSIRITHSERFSASFYKFRFFMKDIAVEHRRVAYEGSWCLGVNCVWLCRPSSLKGWTRLLSYWVFAVERNSLRRRSDVSWIGTSSWPGGFWRGNDTWNGSWEFTIDDVKGLIFRSYV
jgi:hypothetical protein